MKHAIMALAISSLALAIACETVAKTQYGAQLDACIDNAKSKAEADDCLKKIRLEWDEAGAKPALVMDGGAE